MSDFIFFSFVNNVAIETWMGNTCNFYDQVSVYIKICMHLHFRSQIVFGVNSVTKELEKDNLQLVVTCKSANPPILTKHLIGLSETRKCLAICLNGLNKVLSDIVNMGSIAIGLKVSFKLLNRCFV